VGKDLILDNNIKPVTESVVDANEKGTLQRAHTMLHNVLVKSGRNSIIHVGTDYRILMMTASQMPLLEHSDMNKKCMECTSCYCKPRCCLKLTQVLKSQLCLSTGITTKCSW